MKILHTIPSMGILSGGPIFSTWLTVQGERMLGIDSLILAYDVYSKGDSNITTESYLLLIPSSVDKKCLYSNSYSKALSKSDVDLFHIQGIWQYPTLSSVLCAKRKHKPYIITLRGMLYPQALKKSFLWKKIVLCLYLKFSLQHASCLHATCIEEMEHLRNMGIFSPIAVIPNPIQTDDIQDEIVSPDKLRIGYLGRIHPRKRIERILYAVDSLLDKEIEIMIIGDGDPCYMQYLQEEVQRLQLKQVVFTGFLNGEEKKRALKMLSYLIVPSDFENFGNIITEAMVHGIPVIASKGTPWQELNMHHCGWWVDNDVDTLAATIREALALSEEERIAMGKRGQQLVKENYSVEMVALKMKELYEWILYGGEKPEFVYLK